LYKTQLHLSMIKAKWLTTMCFWPCCLFFCGAFAPLVSWGQSPSVATYSALDTLFSNLTEASAEDRVGKAYDQTLLLRNASIDREILMRQKLRHADAQTLRLSHQKDSLHQVLSRVYEQPFALRQANRIADLSRTIHAIEDSILHSLQNSLPYFLSLSTQFMRAVYDNDPSLRCLFCRWKTTLKKGNYSLADGLSRYALARDRAPYRWQQIRNELTPREAAIEFVSYWDVRYGVRRYGALVLKRNNPALRFVPLCLQSDLDDVLSHGNIEEAYYLGQLYNPTDDGNPTLYALIWQPIEPLLQGIKKCYYAPAGDLHRLNLAALSPQERMPSLLDRYEFIRINSTRSLINPFHTGGEENDLPPIPLPCKLRKNAPLPLTARFFGSIAMDYNDPGLQETRSAVLIGNIYYEMDSAAIRSPKARYPALQSNNTGIPRKRQQNRTGEWDFLYGTKTEIEISADLLKSAGYKVKLWEGYASSEEAFKTLGKNDPSPRILHIATHGFFLADTFPKKLEHSMNRMGLVLAGANYAWKRGKPVSGMEDGILTALEIASMDLKNTELVVLSACETGLGYILNNEGVFGLQRAFRQAGAKNLMVSLWSVPDQATQLLMTQFYQNCLTKDMSLRDALRSAQQWMRGQDAYQNPYYWAGFVLLE
jgi:CHAT domain-containing protein